MVLDSDSRIQNLASRSLDPGFKQTARDNLGAVFEISMLHGLPTVWMQLGMNIVVVILQKLIREALFDLSAPLPVTLTPHTMRRMHATKCNPG